MIQRKRLCLPRAMKIVNVERTRGTSVGYCQYEDDRGGYCTARRARVMVLSVSTTHTSQARQHSDTSNTLYGQCYVAHTRNQRAADCGEDDDRRGKAHSRRRQLQNSSAVSRFMWPSHYPVVLECTRLSSYEAIARPCSACDTRSLGHCSARYLQHHHTAQHSAHKISPAGR